MKAILIFVLEHTFAKQGYFPNYFKCEKLEEHTDLSHVLLTWKMTTEIM